VGWGVLDENGVLVDVGDDTGLQDARNEKANEIRQKNFFILFSLGIAA